MFMPCQKILSQEKCGSDLKLVFLHLPKTGGLSLSYHLKDNFPQSEVCPEQFSGLDQFSEEQLGRWRLFSGHFNADEIKRIPGRTFLVTVFRHPIDRLLSLYYHCKRHSYAFIEEGNLEWLRIIKRGTLLDFLRSDHREILPIVQNVTVTQLAGAITTTPNGYCLTKGLEKNEWLSETQLLSMALNNLLSFDVIGKTSELSLVYEKVALVFGMKTYPSIIKINAREQVTEVLEPITPEPITAEIQSLLEEKTRLDRMLYQLASDHMQSRRHQGIHG